MPHTPESQRRQQAQKLAAELRDLQDRMNRTISQLCDLVTGQSFQDVAAVAQRTQGPADQGPLLVPSFLEFAIEQPFVANPSSGHVLSADARLYSNNQRGIVQVLQQPRSRLSDANYSLVFNYADFDGDLLSVVVDGRPLLSQVASGHAQVSVTLETTGSHHGSVYLKCAWRSEGQWSERISGVRSNQVAVTSFEIPGFDPETVDALDLHLIFNPQSRGCLEIRRLAAHLTVTPAVAAASTPAVSVFESAP